MFVDKDVRTNYDDFPAYVAKVCSSKREKEIMKKWKVVGWASIACLCIAAIAIQATFGGGGIGLSINPKDVETTPGSTITYDITVYNLHDTPDSFDVYVNPRSCDSDWFSWLTKKSISIRGRSHWREALDVTPTKTGNFTFTVEAVSRSGDHAMDTAHITVEEPVINKPDLIITDIWHVGEVIHYEIKNIGNANAPAGSETTLFADDVSVKEDHVSTPLAPGESVEGYFENYDWIMHCTPPHDKIKVCADNNNVIDELDESNNCSVETWPCNRKPTCIALTPDKSEPQDYGIVINWTACAYDPDGDQLEYRFLLQGPGTGSTIKVIQDWSKSNEWVWKTNKGDIGDSNIYADVKDGHHADDSTTPDYDLYAMYSNYTITPPNQPPYCACLMPDKSEPQPWRTKITWSACAIDPEGDPLWYRFWLRGPGTGNVWQEVKPWSTSNTWTWVPTFAERGDNDMKVDIRDGYYVPYPDYSDVNATYYDYRIRWG